jgi:acyl dehydratase
VGGPYFDDLSVGQVFDTAPGLTLTDGRAAQHHAIVGDRWRLALDDHLARKVAGAPVASPTLVWNVAIGQSTLATQRVRANLFYRRLALLRQPLIGDTLRTTTSVVGLRENTRREGRPPTGLVALHMQTIDQEGRRVLDFFRCAMIPLSPGVGPTGRADDLDAIGADLRPGEPAGLIPAWDRPALPAGTASAALHKEAELVVATGDVVSNAPELARLTLNVAAVHHDRFAAGGQRLVYGGHTIALAAAQVSRALPDLLTVLAWKSCDHTGPVYEGETLTTKVTIERIKPIDGWQVLDLRAEVTADGERPVLDWRFSALA